MGNSAALLRGRILVLMKHYYQPNESPEVARMVGEDWMNALADFPFEAVEEACRKWIATGTRRPTPAEIRAFAVEAEETMRIKARNALPAPTIDPKTDSRQQLIHAEVRRRFMATSYSPHISGADVLNQIKAQVYYEFQEQRKGRPSKWDADYEDYQKQQG